MVYTENIRFEWDSKKAAQNLEKHGISFEEAITAFDDPFAFLAKDEKHSSDAELREYLLGESDHGILMVIFTVRNIRYRIISARKANRKEKAWYEKAKRISL